MRGRKPLLGNVIPMRHEEEAAAADAMRKRALKRVVRSLCPRDLDPEVRKEWGRVARILAEPTVDRLKPRYADVIVEYCRVVVRLRRLRASFAELAAATTAPGKKADPIAAEIHVTIGRNGEQLKAHPHVAQINESWRQWRSLVAMLGLSPTDERNLIPGQGDMFDDVDRYFSGG